MTEFTRVPSMRTSRFTARAIAVSLALVMWWVPASAQDPSLRRSPSLVEVSPNPAQEQHSKKEWPISYGARPLPLHRNHSFGTLSYRGAYFGKAGIELERRGSRTVEVGGVTQYRALGGGGVKSAPELENLYRAMFQWLPLPIVLLDERFFIVLANRAAAELLHLRKTAPVSFATVVRKRNAEDLIRDISANQVKVVQIDIKGTTRRPPRTLKITATRLQGRLGQPGSSRRLQSRSRVQEFRLLIIQEVTSEVILQEQLVEAERLAGMGQLAAGIAHELANPLASIASNLQYLRNSLPAGQNRSIREAVETTAERVDDMRELLTTLSSFTRRRHPRYELADFHDLIRRTLIFIAREAEDRHIRIVASFAPSGLSCQMDVRMMKQVLLNLLKNAMEAMPEGGRLEIRTEQSEASDDEPASALIELKDSGVGISETDLRKVFRPLFSTKPRGTGLGLPFCRQVIEEHGGEIRINSRKGSGTTVTFTIPIHEEPVSLEEQDSYS